MATYHIDYSDADDKYVAKYFYDDRSRAMAAARRLSRKGLLVYMVRSDGFCRSEYRNTGHICFSNGVIVDRDGEAA